MDIPFSLQNFPDFFSALFAAMYHRVRNFRSKAFPIDHSRQNSSEAIFSAEDLFWSRYSAPLFGILHVLHSISMKAVFGPTFSGQRIVFEISIFCES
jgi:hypothetical protein